MPRSVLIAVALLIAPRPSGAVDLPLRIDLDGDRREELVELADGQLRVTSADGARAQLPLGELRGARLHEAGGGFLFVRGRGAAGELLVVAALRGGRLDEAHRGPVGPAGRDGEYSITVERRAKELHRYQTAPGVTRCDGEARLFAERWRPGAGWAPLSIPVPEGPLLRARGAPPAGLRRMPLPLYRACAASAQVGADRADRLAPPREIEDGRAETAWRVPGEGRGAWITLRTDGAGGRVRALLIAPATGPAAPAAPRRLAAIFADGKTFRFDVSSAGTQWVELPQAADSPCVSIAIVEGGRGEATGLGEVGVYSELESQGTIGLLRLAAGEEPAVGEGAARALLGLPAAETAALVLGIGQVLPSARGAGRRRLAEVLALRVLALDEAGRRELRAPLATVLHTALRGAGAAERPELLRALGALPDPEEALAGLAEDRTADASTRAEALGQLGQRGSEAALRALLRVRDGLRAEGAPRALRRALQDGLTAVARCLPEGDPRMQGLIAHVAERLTADAPGSAVDLIEVLGRAASCRERTSRRATAQVLARAWSCDPGGEDFLFRYRILQAIGQLGEAAEAPVGSNTGEVLQRALESDEPVLRRAAVEAAAALGPGFAPLVRQGLADRDPGVRMAALSSLGVRRDPAALPSVEKALAEDRWPQVRRVAAEARASLCAAPEKVASLRKALQDPDREVQRRALAGVVRCEGHRAEELLVQVARDDAADPALRGQAAALLSRLLGPAAASALRALLLQVVRDAGADGRQVSLAAACMRALVQAAGPAALPTLVEVLGDSGAVDAAIFEQISSLCKKAVVQPAQRRRLTASLAAAARSQDERLRAAAAAVVRRCAP